MRFPCGSMPSVLKGILMANFLFGILSNNCSVKKEDITRLFGEDAFVKGLFDVGCGIRPLSWARI